MASQNMGVSARVGPGLLHLLRDRQLPRRVLTTHYEIAVEFRSAAVAENVQQQIGLFTCLMRGGRPGPEGLIEAESLRET